MRTIWKYAFGLGRRSTLRIPECYEILSVQFKDCVPTLWCLVDDEAPPQDVEIHVVGTGHHVPPYLSAQNHIGSVQEPGTPFVWHIFHIARPTGAAH